MQTGWAARIARATGALILSLGVMALDVQGAEPANAHPNPGCVIHPYANILRNDVEGNPLGPNLMQIGADRIYLTDYEYNSGSTGQVLGVDTRVLDFQGKEISRISDFIVYQVDDGGDLWGSGFAGGDYPDGVFQVRSPNGTLFVDDIPVDPRVIGLVRSFGAHQWLHEPSFDSIFPPPQSNFFVFDAAGNLVTSIPADNEVNFLESGYTYRTEQPPLVSGYGDRVAVIQQRPDHDHVWPTLYRNDGSLVVELPPPPGASTYRSIAVLVTAESVLVLEYSGASAAGPLHRYSRSGSYLGTIDAPASGAFAWFAFNSQGLSPAFQGPAVIVDGNAFWLGERITGSTQLIGEVYRISGSSASRLSGLSNAGMIAESNDTLHVHDDTLFKAFNATGSPRGGSVPIEGALSRSAVYPTAFTSDGRLILSYDGKPTPMVTDSSRHVAVISENGQLFGTIEPAYASDLAVIAQRGDLLAMFGPAQYGNNPIPSRLMLYDIAKCRTGEYDGRFSDDDGSVFEGAIEWLADQGITQGCNPPQNTRFCPNERVTRGQMATFLVRALKYSAIERDFFNDDTGHIFENAINRLRTAGVTQGCNPPSNNRFCPDRFVTRGEMAAFLVRAFRYSDSGAGNYFVDDNGNIFENAIDRLRNAGVTLGCNPPSNNQYCPDDYVTRGQMAAFLKRALS